MSNSQKILFYLALAFTVFATGSANYLMNEWLYRGVQDKQLNDFFAPTQKIEAQYVAAQIERRMTNIMAILQTSAELSGLQKIGTKCPMEQVAVIERAIASLKDNIDYLALIDNRGTVICAPNLKELEGQNLADYPHIKEAIATGRSVVSRAVINPVGVKLISVNVPVFNGGEFAGILSGAIRLDSFSKELGSVASLTPSAYNTLIDDDGAVLVHPRTDFILENIKGELIQRETLGDPDLNNAFRRMLNQEAGYNFYTFGDDRKIVGYAPAKILNGNRFFIVTTTAKMEEYGYIGEGYLAKTLVDSWAIMTVAAVLMLTIFYWRYRPLRIRAGNGGSNER